MLSSIKSFYDQGSFAKIIQYLEQIDRLKIITSTAQFITELEKSKDAGAALFVFKDKCKFCGEQTAVFSKYLPSVREKGAIEYQFMAVNIGKHPEMIPLLRSYGCKGFPSTIIFKKGVVDQIRTGIANIFFLEATFGKMLEEASADSAQGEDDSESRRIGEYLVDRMDVKNRTAIDHVVEILDEGPYQQSRVMRVLKNTFSELQQ